MVNTLMRKFDNFLGMGGVRVRDKSELGQKKSAYAVLSRNRRAFLLKLAHTP